MSRPFPGTRALANAIDLPSGDHDGVSPRASVRNREPSAAAIRISPAAVYAIWSPGARVAAPDAETKTTSAVQRAADRAHKAKPYTVSGGLVPLVLDGVLGLFGELDDVALLEEDLS